MSRSNANRSDLKVFLCGDVMLGRGIDQILPHRCEPTLYEPAVTDARQYVQLAEEANGRIERPVDYTYVWGEALDVLNTEAPHLRLINLETSVTDSASPWPEKGIHYRMHPNNAEVLSTAGIDGCTLANNHVLDWDQAGLKDTLAVLNEHGVQCAGAGHSAREAAAPARFPLPDGGRLLFLACGLGSSGIPQTWAATDHQPGVFRLPDLSAGSVELLRQCLGAERRPGDRVIVSIHWGGNWGYAIEPDQQRFAHALIDDLNIDLVHGHSSHHPRPMEVYRDKLILYGCGDFLNDYEGIGGNEGYRGDLTLMYFPSLDADGRLRSLRMKPLQIRRLSLHTPSEADQGWLEHTLNRINVDFGTGVQTENDGALKLVWS